MKHIAYCVLLSTVVLASSCVSKKKAAGLQAQVNDLKTENARLSEKLRVELGDCQQKSASLQSQLDSKATELAAKGNQVKELQDQLDYLKRTNSGLLDRMADLSVVSKQGAESIKKSLEALDNQNKYIQGLNNSIQRKDSLNMTLVMNLKRSLANVNDEDVTVEVKKGVVYVSISDKLLFQVGQANVTARAEEVLGKVARVINDHKELEVMVEGHTDSAPISTELFKDNWDLSVKRATSVVRLLQQKFNVEPDRMTAAGRGEYVPKDSNSNAAGRKQNRRTEIILTPKLDQFFELLTPQNSK
ncbi:OmpA/MotB family protein [Siphonobacter aquaeclarae]|uniref:Chemotaxis protein MotB n=1 Tax=Siphonobacter aquaeclarae TaxID=563176 RepID=A0A1G9MJQ1_9BACT|nr:flagellar motor protein MotB [Siphonobacter aquaeclarae]SDL74498.1 chemotaxis protein MotB [Siphonobacter aquaeclarae]